MIKRSQALVIVFSFLLGIIYFAYQKEWLIIRSPLNINTFSVDLKKTVPKKTVTLYYWHNDQWNHENSQLLWPDQKEEQLMFLTNKWLNILYEEHILEKKIMVQSIIITPLNCEAFISFDRNPLKKENSTYANLMIIESLLKTMRENDIKIQGIYFLLNHRPLNDHHLDFSNAWPINGFIQEQ